MKTNYFNSSIITPLVKASTQHAQMIEGDIVFDWTAFDIPRGAARLLGAIITTRHNKVASQVGGIDLVFARSGPNSVEPATIGVGNALYGVTNFANTDLIGFLPGQVTDISGEGTSATAVTIQSNNRNKSNIILEPFSGSPNVRGNSPTLAVGYDRYYVAGLASGALDLRGLVASTGAIDVSGEDGTITDIDGTSPELVFAPGDILHFSDDIILGEVAAVSDTPDITFKFDGSTSTNHAVVAGNATYDVPENITKWRVQNGAGAAGDGANDEIIYNVFPMRITLSFEK